MHTRGVDNGVTSENVGARDARRCDAAPVHSLLECPRARVTPVGHQTSKVGFVSTATRSVGLRKCHKNVLHKYGTATNYTPDIHTARALDETSFA